MPLNKTRYITLGLWLAAIRRLTSSTRNWGNLRGVEPYSILHEHRTIEGFTKTKIANPDKVELIVMFWAPCSSHCNLKLPATPCRGVCRWMFEYGGQASLPPIIANFDFKGWVHACSYHLSCAWRRGLTASVNWVIIILLSKFRATCPYSLKKRITYWQSLSRCWSGDPTARAV